jgi:hypothetical protein
MASLSTGTKTLIATTATGEPAAIAIAPTGGLSLGNTTSNAAGFNIQNAAMPATTQATLVNQIQSTPGLNADGFINPTTGEAFSINAGKTTGTANVTSASKSGSTGASGSSASSSESEAEKPCPDCGLIPGTKNAGKQSTNKKKKPVSDTNSWFPNQPFAGLNFLQIGAAVLESIGNFFNNLMDILEIKEGKCRTCEGKRTVKDKSNQQPEIQKTVAAANAQKEKLTDLESKASGGTGLGGNDVKVVVGSKFLKVGMAYNDSQSYESVKEGKDVPSKVQIDKQGPTKTSRKIAQVNGLNPLPTIGGNYTMEIGNHFKLRAGAQGIELSTEGPLIVKAGQTQFVGPEVVIGTATGETRITGNHLQLDGESIALTPGRNGDGQVVAQGTFACTGNMIAQGGAHIEGDLSFISATCPYKEERTKHSSQETEFTGPAKWSAFAAVQGAKDFLRTLTVRTLDPSMIILTPRQILNLIMDAKELGQKALPLELIPTGVVIGVMPGPAILPIWNFPHHHTLTDQIHAHNMRVPNINLLESDEQVRGPAKAKELRAPVPANKESALLKLFKLIQVPYQLVVATIQRLGT